MYTYAQYNVIWRKAYQMFELTGNYRYYRIANWVALRMMVWDGKINKLS